MIVEVLQTMLQILCLLGFTFVVGTITLILFLIGMGWIDYERLKERY